MAVVRNGLQHASALPEAVAAAERLGFSFPVLDPDAVWWGIVNTVINALSALREEIATIPT